MKKKAYAYIRVSTKKQAKEGISLEAQKMKLYEWAKGKGYGIAQFFIDKGRTGTNINRPEFRRMMEMAELTKPDVIVCYQSDRLARNTLDHSQIRKQLQDWGIKLMYTNMDIDLTQPGGKLIDNLMSSVNEYQSDIIKLKTYDSMLAKARSGWPPKEAAIGYLNVVNKHPKGTLDKKIIVIDTEVGPLVVECFELYSTGNYSFQDLADFLNDKKVKPKRSKKCTARLVEYMLKNKFYTGIFDWGGETHQGKYEPLISKELYHKVLEMIAKRNHYACRARKYTFLLNGFLYYKDTKGRAYAEYHENWTDDEARYYDSTKARGSYIKATLLEKSVEKYMHKIQLTEEYRNKIMEMVESIINERRGRIDSEKRRLSVQKTEMENAIRNLEDDRFVRDSIESDRFAELYNRYLQELRETNIAIESLNIDYTKRVKQLEKVLNLAQNIGEAYQKADIHEKKTYLGIFIKKIWVKNRRICHIELNDNVKQLIEGGSICVRTSWGG